MMGDWWNLIDGMFCFTLSRVGKALLLQIFNIDIQQTSQADAVIQDFTRPLDMGMDFEHLLITRDNGRYSTHVNNALTNPSYIKFLAAQQKDYLVAEFLLNLHTAPFYGAIEFRFGRAGQQDAVVTWPDSPRI